MSTRAFIAGFAVWSCAAALAQAPIFRADGPRAEIYGGNEGYPHCTALTYLSEQRCLVGALSHFDTLFPARSIRAPAVPSVLRRPAAEPDLRYTHHGRPRTLREYVESHAVSGLLVAQGDTILVERYQYARNDKHRMASFSMAKSIVGLLVGLALQDGAIGSIDDLAQTYVPALKGTAYGETSIKVLLQMASGVRFDENYVDRNSDIYKLALLTLGQGQGGAIEAVRQFGQRVAPPGRRYSYSSAESTVLGLVVAHATRRNLSDYTQEKLWGPVGAEADASWNIDAKGMEIGFAYFNAVLRDWARLGLMLAHEGQWNGHKVVPREWITASTTIGPDSTFWSSSATPGQHLSGYGYHFWLLATQQRTFAMRGLRGQWVMVDPASKLVLVQTAVRPGSDGWMDEELLSLWKGLLQQLR